MGRRRDGGECDPGGGGGGVGEGERDSEGTASVYARHVIDRCIRFMP